VSLYTDIAAAYSGTGANRVGDLLTYGKGEEILTTTVLIENVHGMRIKGPGRARKYRWQGPAGVPIFRLLNCQACTLEDFEVTVDVGYTASRLVTFEDDNAGAIRSSQCGMRGVHVQNQSGRLVDGIGILDAPGKNDLHWFEHVVLQGLGGTDFSNECASAVNILLTDCHFQGRTTGQRGIRTVNGGTLTMVRGSVTQHSIAELDIDTRHGVVSFQDVHFEDLVRLLVGPSPAPSANRSTLRLIGARISQPADKVPLDQELVQYLTGGTLVWREGTIGLADPVAPFRVRYESNVAYSVFDFEDVTVSATNDSDFWRGRAPRSVDGSRLHRGAADFVPFPHST
jgi:hypothetical protein